ERRRASRRLDGIVATGAGSPRQMWVHETGPAWHGHFSIPVNHRDSRAWRAIAYHVAADHFAAAWPYSVKPPRHHRASFIEMVFEAFPVFTAWSAKEHIIGLQRSGPQHPVGLRPVLRNQEDNAVSHAVVRPADPAKIKFLVGDHQAVDRRRQSVERPDPGIGRERVWYSRLPFGDNSGVLRLDVEKVVGVDSVSRVGGNRAGDR